MKYDVFISYSRKDTKIVNHICNELKKNGISFFIDRKGISGGFEFPEIIAEAIENSKVFLFVGSQNSYDSRYAVNEVTFAYNLNKKNSIIPYLIDNAPLPRSLQFIFGSVNYRTIKEHPIKTLLISDLKHMLSSFEEDNALLNAKEQNPDNTGTRKPNLLSLSYITDKHLGVTLCASLQIILLVFCYSFFFFLFQKGYVAQLPHHIVWWTNVMLTTFILLSLMSTIFVMTNKKKAFYAICLLDVLQVICIYIIATSTYNKNYAYQSLIYGTLNDIGAALTRQPVVYISVMLLFIVLHCVAMWGILHLKKNNRSAWSMLK